MLAVNLLYVALIVFTNLASIPILFRVFILKECWVLSNDFLHQLKWSCDFYSWLYLCGVSHLLSGILWIFFASLERKQFDHGVLLLKLLWDLVCKYFIKNTLSMLIKNIEAWVPLSFIFYFLLFCLSLVLVSEWYCIYRMTFFCFFVWFEENWYLFFKHLENIQQ